MKKAISILLLICILMSVALMGGCDSEPAAVEEGATVVTLYAQSFEQWSNDYLQKRVNEFNQNLTDGIQLEVKFFTDSD